LTQWQDIRLETIARAIREGGRRMGEILVIKTNNFKLSPQDMHNLRQQIIKQKEEKVVVLPYYCEPIIVPEDVDIRVEEDNR